MNKQGMGRRGGDTGRDRAGKKGRPRGRGERREGGKRGCVGMMEIATQRE